MSGKPETSVEAVYRMYIVEGKSNHEIVEIMKGRVKAVTVRDYIRAAVAKAKAKGDVAIWPLRPKELKKRGGFTARANQTPVSQLHVTIGNRLSLHRTTVESLSLMAFLAAHPNFASHVTLGQMEVGVHDFTLGELQKIAAILGIPLSQLMEPKTAHQS